MENEASEKVTLFESESPDIKISIRMYFNKKDQLYFDGYDIGKRVNEAWGDSDYEYTYTIEPEEVKKFYKLFKLTAGDRLNLLYEFKKRFGVNEAYTLLGDFMKKHKIKYDSFTWS